MTDAITRRVQVRVSDAAVTLTEDTTMQDLLDHAIPEDRARALIKHRDENILTNLRFQRDWNTLLSFASERFGIAWIVAIIGSMDTHQTISEMYDAIEESVEASIRG